MVFYNSINFQSCYVINDWILLHLSLTRYTLYLQKLKTCSLTKSEGDEKLIISLKFVSVQVIKYF